MYRLPFFFVLAVCVLGTTLAASKKPRRDSKKGDAGAVLEEAVVTITTDSFDEFIQNNKLALVEFYAPWCGHCKRLEPEYEAAAKELKAAGGKVVFAKVDATVESELASRFDIGGYPTLKFFRDGKPEEYRGGRTKATIIQWIDMMTGASVVLFETKEAAAKEAAKAGIAFVGVFAGKESPEFELFQQYADANRLYGKFMAYFSADEKPELRVYRNEEGVAAVTDDFSKESLEKFCEVERFPYFGPINGDNYMNYFSTPRDVAWFVGSAKDYESVGAAVREAAKAVREQYNFVWLDSDEFKDHAQSSLGVKEFPSLVAQKKQGRFFYPEKQFDGKAIVNFLNDLAAGKVERSLLSEPIPETNDAPVKVVVAKNFNEMVLQPDKDVLLEVYAPWCGHCKKFEPIYAEFAEKMKNNAHVVVAKMDGTANESPNEDFSWSGFPTVFFVKAGSRTPLLFEGSRTVEGLLEYIKEHSSKPVTDDEDKDEL